MLQTNGKLEQGFREKIAQQIFLSHFVNIIDVNYESLSFELYFKCFFKCLLYSTLHRFFD